MKRAASSPPSTHCTGDTGSSDFCLVGLVCTQDVFQRKVDETFGDLPSVTGIANDIVDANLCAVLQRARETGLRMNPDKLRV
jgi:hypothetical protein